MSCPLLLHSFFPLVVFGKCNWRNLALVDITGLNDRHDTDAIVHWTMMFHVYIRTIQQTTCVNRHQCLAKSCSQFCLCCSTTLHCFTLSSHIINTHVNIRICYLLQCTFLKDAKVLEKIMKFFWDELSIVATLMFAVLHVLLNSLALFHPVQSYHP